MISDAREVILLLGGGTEGVVDESGSALAIWSNHAGLASFARNYFDFLWAEAVPYPDKKRKAAAPARD